MHKKQEYKYQLVQRTYTYTYIKRKHSLRKRRYAMYTHNYVCTHNMPILGILYMKTLQEKIILKLEKRSISKYLYIIDI